MLYNKHNSAQGSLELFHLSRIFHLSRKVETCASSWLPFAFSSCSTASSWVPSIDDLNFRWNLHYVLITFMQKSCPGSKNHNQRARPQLLVPPYGSLCKIKVSDQLGSHGNPLDPFCWESWSNVGLGTLLEDSPTLWNWRIPGWWTDKNVKNMKDKTFLNQFWHAIRGTYFRFNTIIWFFYSSLLV